MKEVNPRSLTDEQLADKYGALSGRLADLETQKDALKDEFLRRRRDVIDGKRYRLKRRDARVDEMLDVKLIRALMDPDWIRRMSRDKPVAATCEVKAITNKRHVNAPSRAKKPKPELAPVVRVLETVH